MLVLSRKIGEKIVIGGNIIITVVEVQGNKVRLGIAGPRDVRIDREEIAEAKATAQSNLPVLTHRR